MKKKYILILLKDGRNILVSDEEIEIDDWCYGMDGIFQYKGKVNIPDIYLPNKIIAGIYHLPTLIYSDEVKQELRDKYGWADIENLVNTLETPDDFDQFSHDKGFEKGFKTHQQLTDKMFSLKQVENLYKGTLQNVGTSIKQQDMPSWEQVLQSLLQPIELKVEIEMEETCKMCNQEYQKSGCSYAGCGSMDTLLQPKTINNSILITKMI